MGRVIDRVAFVRWFSSVYMIVNGLAASAWAEPRTWYAAQGGFSVEAELVDVREGKVFLKKADGTEISVEIAKLSLADIRFAESELEKARNRLQRKMGGEDEKNTSASSPFEPTTSEREVAGKQAKEPAGSSTSIDSQDPPLPGWDATVDLSGESPFAGMKEVHFVLGRVYANEFFVPATSSAWVAVRRSGPKEQFQVGNIRTGKSFNPFSVDERPSEIAISPDGTLLATLGGYPGVIKLYASSSGKKFKEIPAAEDFSVQHLFFAAPEKLVALSSSSYGDIALFDVKTGKKVKSIPCDNNSVNKFALSPTGKLLATASYSNTVSIYDLETGEKKNDLVVGAMNAKSNPQIEYLAFCGNGTELAVLVNLRSSCGLQVFSTKTGRLVAQHVLADTLSNIAGHHSSYKGAAVESLLDNQGWMLFGSAIVDRENGGPIWVDKREQVAHSYFRALIDNDHQLRLVGDYQSSHFTIARIPWSEIEASKNVVAEGGTVEDVGLPPVTEVNWKSIPTLVESSSEALFHSQPVLASPVPETVRLKIDPALGRLNNLKFPSPLIEKCVADVVGTEAARHRALLIDLESGKVEQTVEADFVSRFLGVSPDAHWIVGTSGNKEDRLDVFDLKSGEHHIAFRPYRSADNDGRVISADFLGNDLLLTSGWSENSVVWKLPDLEPIYALSKLGRIGIFPRSQRFVYRSKEGWCVRSSATGELEGMLEPSPDDEWEYAEAVAINSEETRCAVISGDKEYRKLIAWDLLTGKRILNVRLSSVVARIWAWQHDRESGQFTVDTSVKTSSSSLSLADASDLSWCEDGKLLLEWTTRSISRGSLDLNIPAPHAYSIFSIDEKRILWNFRVPNSGDLGDVHFGQVWLRDLFRPEKGVIGIRLPTRKVQQKIEVAPKPKRILNASDSVALNVSVTVSGDKLADGMLQDHTRELVAKALADDDVRVSDRSPLKLNVDVTQVVLVDRLGKKSEPKFLVACALTDISNQNLWMKRGYVEGFAASDNAWPGQDTANRRSGWNNMLDWLSKNIDPTTMYERWYYEGLGESYLSLTSEEIVENRP